MMYSAHAVVFEKPFTASVREVRLSELSDDDVLVDIECSGVSTGTEKLFWTGGMPAFPGMGYPLIPGYESVGIVRHASKQSTLVPGQRVFVPGSSAYQDVKGLFGGASETVIVAADRLVEVTDLDPESALMLALAATANNIVNTAGAEPGKTLIVGHGVLGRLISRLWMLRHDTLPVVWEVNPARVSGSETYSVTSSNDDTDTDYTTVIDASGSASMLDQLIGRLSRHGQVVLGGFYPDRLSFDFAPAFMRSATIKVASEWTPADLGTVRALISDRSLVVADLLTHRFGVSDAMSAYDTAFNDASCLKSIVDWRLN